MEEFFSGICTNGVYLSSPLNVNYYDKESSILPITNIFPGSYSLLWITNEETKEITEIIEYRQLLALGGYLERSYVSFVESFLKGKKVRMTFTKEDNNYELTSHGGSIFINNELVLCAGYYTSNLPESVRIGLNSEDVWSPSVDDLSKSTIFVDSTLLESGVLLSLYKQLKKTFFPNLDSYTVIKDLHSKAYKKISIEPKYKRPAERVTFLKNLPKILVDVEEDEVEQVEIVDTVSTITVEVEPEKEWTPPGFEW